MATVEAKECVAAGVNPAEPDRDDPVLCWGDKCRGTWSANGGTGATCGLVHADACACYRLKMGMVKRCAAKRHGFSILLALGTISWKERIRVW